MTETKHQAKVGDIYEMSWGYDQTNIDYFQVTRVTPKGVFVREIGSSVIQNSEGFMCCRVKPNKDNFLERASWCCRPNVNENRETFRKLDERGGFNFKGRYFARLVQESSQAYCSWYA